MVVKGDNIMNRDGLNIMSNIKAIEELKANLICIIGDFFKLLAKGSNVSKDAILDCISGAIMILYFLGEKLGYEAKEVDEDIVKKLKTGITEEQQLEKEGKSLSKLLKQFREKNE